jgi:hypothetical protein
MNVKTMPSSQKSSFRTFPHSLFAILLCACEPPFAPPNAPGTPCPEISATEYENAMKAGATGAIARIGASGTVSMETGPGIKHCPTYNSAMKPCRRPNDFVIRYETAEGNIFYVRVPAGEQYRFNVHRMPNTCEIVNSEKYPSNS